MSLQVTEVKINRPSLCLFLDATGNLALEPKIQNFFTIQKAAD